MVTKRLCRAIRLLFLLRQSDGLSLQKIALLLDCSHRTAAADLQVLRNSGFEVVWTAGGYRVVAPDEPSEVVEEREELLSLLETLDAFPLLRSDLNHGPRGSSLRMSPPTD